ncbi:MAG: glycosyltransferase family 1 protein, partial [bacterium]|nr:glycosyltransferase family 1 protein [bacterium]
MNIGIDISQMAYKGTGVARFTRGLVESVLEHDIENTWIFVFSSLRQKLDRDLLIKIRSSRHKVILLSVPPTILSLLFNDLHSFSQLLTTNYQPLINLDWFITSDWTEPKLSCKKATIVHDLVFKKFPKTVDSTILNTQEKRLKWVTQESDIIFVDSKTTSTDMQNEYAVNTNRLVVNYPGVSIPPIPEIGEQRIMVKQLGITNPYVLTVGKREPRKNFDVLIEAFKEVKKGYKGPLDLVMVGPKGWGSDVEMKQNIHILDYVPDKELSALYAQATCFVLPSLYEGFGYPVIEAMHHGCPVA